MTMEITINIKLEDEDLALLIKSLWEIIKKIPNVEDSVPIEIIRKEDLKEKDLSTCEEFLNTTDNKKKTRIF